MTRSSQRRRWLTLGAILLVAIAGLWTYRYLNRPDGITADCGWTGSAKAWVDANSNQQWDAGEQPLAGVRFHLDDVRNKYTDVGKESISNEHGAADLSVWLPGCPDVAFEVYAVPPPGYRVTTQARVPGEGKGPFLFGFEH